MTDQEKMQYIQYMQIKEELDNVAYGGIELKLDGRATSSHIIATACVFQEDSDYMRDFRHDDAGRIAELNFGKLEKNRFFDYQEE